MIMSTIVSVVIPTFNRARLVQEAVESVLSQQGDFTFDIVVVDDGSTPETEEALRRFGNSICYVRQQNAGLNPARNHGLRLAKGAYIALLDDDDVWLPFKTSLLMRAIEEFPQAGFVHSDFFIWKPEDNSRRPNGLQSWHSTPLIWDDVYETRRDVQFGEGARELRAYFGDVYYRSLFGPMVLPSTAIIRRSALEGAEFPAIDSVGDWEFFARLAHRRGAVFVPTETTLNRSHEDAFRLTRVDQRLRMRRRLNMMKRLWRADPAFMRSKGEEVDRVEAACLRKLAKLGILKGDRGTAREAMAALGAMGEQRTLADAMLWLLARTPFLGTAASLVRAARNRMISSAKS